MWLTVTYLVQTIGELCLSPVGLSAMTKLAPRRIGSLMMGVLFLSNSTGNYLGGRMASVSESLPLPMLFGVVGMVAVVLSGVLAALNGTMKRLTAGED
jgi:POT family proton-dependent oligopeptide transporter